MLSLLCEGLVKPLLPAFVESPNKMKVGFWLTISVNLFILNLKPRVFVYKELKNKGWEKIMKLTKNTANLIYNIESIIGNNCYNKQSGFGFGDYIRYPVWAYTTQRTKHQFGKNLDITRNMVLIQI